MDYVAVAGVIVASVGAAITIGLMLKQSRRDERLKRVAVYSAIQRYLNAATQIDRVPIEVERAFHEATEEPRIKLLFEDDDARAYVNELRWKANELRKFGALEAGFPDGDRKSRIVLKRLHFVQWMEQQRSSELEKRLGKYL